MAVFTKTYVQCDLCEQQRELPESGDGWFRVEATISKLASGSTAGATGASGQTESQPEQW